MPQWEPYVPRGPRLRISATSCCGEYELASEGGQYFVLRPDEAGGHEETARGLYGRAVAAWLYLAERHACMGQAS